MQAAPATTRCGGKGGADTFFFAEAGASNRDTIFDFGSDDKIVLDHNIFTGLDGNADGNVDGTAFLVTSARTGDGATGPVRS